MSTRSRDDLARTRIFDRSSPRGLYWFNLVAHQARHPAAQQTHLRRRCLGPLKRPLRSGCSGLHSITCAGTLAELGSDLVVNRRGDLFRGLYGDSQGVPNPVTLV